MKILFITNIPSPYRVDFFNELGKYCELTVLFEKKASDERDLSWRNYKFTNFRGIVLKGISIDTDKAICPNIINYVRDKSYQQIICSDISSPTGMIAIEYMKFNHIQYFIEADGGMAKNGSGIKEKIKKHFISDAKGYFSTSASCDKYFMTYGAKIERIYRYPFTSLKNKDVFENVAEDKEKKRLRNKLDMKEKFVIVSVGRFSYLDGYGKGYDVVLKAALQMHRNDIGWYIIGGKPTEKFEMMTKEMGLSNVYYIDFQCKEDLKEYYRAADVFVLMTVGEAWGLVINEAMACGLPVVTTDKCVAGLELVGNEENGYLIPVGDDATLMTSILKIVETPGKVRQMGEISLKKIRNYTIEKMAYRHYKVLSEK